MIKKISVLLVSLAILSCSKEEETPTDENIMILTGQFQKVLYDKNIWDENIDGDKIEINRNIQFMPIAEGVSTEDMFSEIEPDGKFMVKLKKGETYWNSLFYAGINEPGAEGSISFSESDANNITVPLDAPAEFDLGLIHVATWLPKGTWLNDYIPTESLPWLTDPMLVNSDVPPVISGISKEEIKIYDDDNNYMGSILEFTPHISSSYSLCCNWFLENTDDRASFKQNNINFLRTVTLGTTVSVFTDSFGGHGTLKLIVTDSHAGHATRSITF